MASSSKARVSRRRFLEDAVRVGVGLGAAALWPAMSRAGGPTTRPSRSIVARVFSPRASDGRVLREDILREMIESGLAAITGQRQPKAAWEAVLGSPPQLLLKFQDCGAATLGTSPAMARAMVTSLTAAGLARESLLACELSRSTIDDLSLRPAPFGSTAEMYDFGSGRDEFRRWVQAAPAVINIPFLSDDRICGLACSLKNVGYSAVKHPARMHATRCSPQLADIYALPQIRDRVKLHVCNAVRAIRNGGPCEGEEWLYRTILLSTDPVALDSVALEALELERKAKGVSRSREASPRLAGIRSRAAYLRAASSAGLGRTDPEQIQVIGIEV